MPTCRSMTLSSSESNAGLASHWMSRSGLPSPAQTRQIAFNRRIKATRATNRAPNTATCRQEGGATDATVFLRERDAPKIAATPNAGNKTQ